MPKTSQRLTQQVSLRLSAGEQQKIELASYYLKLTPSEFVRKVAGEYASFVIKEINKED